MPLKIPFQVKDEKLNLTAMLTEEILLRQENTVSYRNCLEKHRTFSGNNGENDLYIIEATKIREGKNNTRE